MSYKKKITSVIWNDIYDVDILMDERKDGRIPQETSIFLSFLRRHSSRQLAGNDI